MNSFIFIAYKSDSVDYCKGCRMASYSSDFYICDALDEVELIKKWSEYLLKNMELDCNEDGYIFHIFKHGVRVYDCNYPSCWLEELTEEIELIFSKANTKALADKQEKDNLLKQKKEQEKLKESQDKLREEFEVYKKLQEKFANNLTDSCYKVEQQ